MFCTYKAREIAGVENTKEEQGQVYMLYIEGYGVPLCLYDSYTDRDCGNVGVSIISSQLLAGAAPPKINLYIKI